MIDLVCVFFFVLFTGMREVGKEKDKRRGRGADMLGDDKEQKEEHSDTEQKNV